MSAKLQTTYKKHILFTSLFDLICSPDTATMSSSIWNNSSTNPSHDFALYCTSVSISKEEADRKHLQLYGKTLCKKKRKMQQKSHTCETTIHREICVWSFNPISSSVQRTLIQHTIKYKWDINTKKWGIPFPLVW